jgi:hypothetical protein
MNWECASASNRFVARWVLLLVGVCAGACSSKEEGPSNAPINTGGVPVTNTGGTPPVTSTGGAPPSTGGAVGSGGSLVASGGTTAATGGVPPVGGSGGTVTASGGAPGSGGAVSGLPATPCNLNTGFPGDDDCILPPPPDKGFQVHIGPSNYQNPEPEYVLKPGEERTNDFQVTSTNDRDVFFFARQYRLRPSAHHVILSTSNGASGVDISGGRRIGTANTSQDYPASGVPAPEDKGVGMPLGAHSRINVSFHAINTTEETVIRELWVNFWYKDAAEVTEPANEWFEVGSATFAIPPLTKQTLGPYTCTVQGKGRMLWLYGHRHANNTRFKVTRVRGTQRDVIYDANRWEEPLLLEYSSTVTNAAPDLAAGREGGWNGILDLMQGDKIEWFCDVDNKQNSTLRFTNQTYLGEMCIVDAEAVGSTCM